MNDLLIALQHYSALAIHEIETYDNLHAGRSLRTIEQIVQDLARNIGVSDDTCADVIFRNGHLDLRR